MPALIRRPLPMPEEDPFPFATARRCLYLRLRDEWVRPGDQCVSLVIATKGEIEWLVDGRQTVLGGGEILVAWPGELGSFRRKRGDELFILQIPESSFDSRGLRGRMRFPVGAFKWTAWLSGQAGKFMAESTARKAGPLVLAQSSRASPLAESLAKRLAKLKAAKLATQVELLRKVETARLLLENRLDQRIDYDRLSRAVGMAPSHLSRAFKAIHGVSPAAYHKRMRMAQAARLLSEGWSPASVRERLAMGTAANFARAYRITHGKPPSSAV